MDEHQRILWELRERVKELTALHGMARLLQDRERLLPDLLREMVFHLPPAWQYPDDAVARIMVGDIVVASQGFNTSSWRQAKEFRLADGRPVSIEVYYLSEHPAASEGPFLAEERKLLDSLTEMLQLDLERRASEQALHALNANLKGIVQERTAQLAAVNVKLRSKIVELEQVNQEVHQYRDRLQQLAAELSRTEAKERRTIAEELHDHVGQALAMVRMRLSRLVGEAVFTGLDRELDELRDVMDQIIRRTRTLTFEISPPVLYELGLRAALDWLAEELSRREGLSVSLRGEEIPRLPEEIEMALFKAARELLMNVTKHARARSATLELQTDGDKVSLGVTDDGEGFLLANVERGSTTEVSGFGLFSIRERARSLGGRMEIHSAPGKGTSVRVLVPLQR
jgi:signal transduction histidine kinase